MYHLPGALERKKAGFVSAALKALEATVAALPGVRSSEAIAALLALAQPKKNGEAASKEVSQNSWPPAHRCQHTCKMSPRPRKYDWRLNLPGKCHAG